MKRYCREMIDQMRDGKQKMGSKLIDASAGEVRNIKRIMNCNRKIISLYSRLLNECPRAIKAELIDELCADGTDKVTAYTSVLSYIFDLDEEKEEDRNFERKYLIPSIRQGKVSDYIDCEYRKILYGVFANCGDWSIGEDRYEAFEAFPCGESVCCSDFTEYPRIAFFDEPFSFPTVSQGGVEWMSLKPNEIETMKGPIERAFGKVTVFGLGLGYFAYCISEKESVQSITVVERDSDVISLFEEILLPQFKNKEKIKIVKCDAFEYMQKHLAGSDSDYVFTDIWHDTSDGLELYLKAKKLENKLPSAIFDYWIEDSIIQRLRSMLFYEYVSEEEELFEGLPVVLGVDSLLRMLSDSSLKEIAKKIKIK